MSLMFCQQETLSTTFLRRWPLCSKHPPRDSCDANRKIDTFPVYVVFLSKTFPKIYGSIKIRILVVFIDRNNLEDAWAQQMTNVVGILGYLVAAKKRTVCSCWGNFHLIKNSLSTIVSLPHSVHHNGFDICCPWITRIVWLHLVQSICPYSTWQLASLKPYRSVNLYT